MVGRAFGLDPEVMIEIFNASTGRDHTEILKRLEHGAGFELSGDEPHAAGS